MLKIRINLALDAGKDLVLHDLEKNRGIGGTEYAVLLLAKQLSDINLFDVFIITKYELKIENAYKFIIEKKIYLNSDVLTVIPEAYLNRFTLTDVKDLVIWLHHPNINIDKINKDYPNSTLVALNNAQVSTFLNKSKSQVYVIKSFYQSIRSCEIRTENFPENTINFGFLGVLRPEKGLHHVASYWKSIVKLYPNSKLHIIGSPLPSVLGNSDEFNNNLYIDKIRKIIGDKNLHTIKFYGQIDDLNPVLSKIDIALLNPFSSTEAYPDSILKFYEYGIPVVSGMFNGSSDLLRTNSKLQFPKINPVKAVEKLIQNKQLFSDSRSNALGFVKNHNDSKIREMWLKLLTSLNSNDNDKRLFLLSNKREINYSLMDNLKILLFRSKYTLNYKIRLFINELLFK